jgi:glyoxylase-like metal-dependent hydrolase (beta-lactamase superfamily II)
MQTLGKHLYRLDLGISNSYLLRGPDTLVLIDTGGHDSVRKISRHLQQHNLQIKDLTHILLTHGHWDHTGNLALIQQQSNATIIAHTQEAPLIRTGKDIRPRVHNIPWLHQRFGSLFDGQLLPAPVHQEIQHGETLDSLYPGLKAIHLPGHSPGHTAYYCESEGWLIGGDVMMHVTPHLTLPLALFTLDPEENKRSILKVNQFGLNTLGLGHGTPILEKAHQAIARIAKRFK